MKLLYQIIAITFLISACGTNASVPPTVSTQTPTRTPRPTRTPLPTLQVALNACVTDTTIRIRNGPGTNNDVIGGLVSGTCVTILGRNQDSSWVYIVTNDSIYGWVAAWLLTVDGAVNRVPLKADSVSPDFLMTFFAPSNTPMPFIFVTSTPQPPIFLPTFQNGNCSSSYSTVCIPPPPPDLDCKDIPYRRFSVVGSDPHGFDGDGDGIGCE